MPSWTKQQQIKVMTQMMMLNCVVELMIEMDIFGESLHTKQQTGKIMRRNEDAKKGSF